METTFWEGLFLTLGTEYKDINSIQGASGINHNIQCLGIDENKKRVLIVQNEQDARILAMAQMDIQSRYKDYNILMLRPVPINLSHAFIGLLELFGTVKLSQKELNYLTLNDESDDKNRIRKDRIETAFKSISPQLEIIEKTSLSLVPIFKELVHQLSHLKFLNGFSDIENFSIDFKEMIGFNPIIYDSAVGVCPIPFYNFTVKETESFLSSKNIETNKTILRNHNILQFFHPPIDTLALGFIESGQYKKEKLISDINQVPYLGHPFGKNEITDIKNITEIVDVLREKDLVVEGEINLELTENGLKNRTKVKFSPRESIFKRLSQIFSIKVNMDLKDLLK